MPLFLAIGERHKKSAFRKGEYPMNKQSVCVNITQPNGTSCTVLKAKERNIRERFLSALFGKKVKLLIVSPCDSVQQITIKENKGGSNDDTNRSIDSGC